METKDIQKYVAVAIVLFLVFAIFYGPRLGNVTNNTNNNNIEITNNIMRLDIPDRVNQDSKALAELHYVDVVPGDTAKIAEPGDTVSVQYVGVFENGDVFDQSQEGNNLTFQVLGNQVIPGFSLAILGLGEGGTRFVRIPPEFGYGDTDLGIIPANSTLYFEVRIVELTKADTTTQ